MAQILFDQIRDFTGGINFRADQFQLKANESPSILNMEVDPRGGVFTRAGYIKKHNNGVSGNWKPKGLYNYNDGTTPLIMLTTGYDSTGPTDGRLYKSTGGDFSTIDSGSSTPLNVKSSNGAGLTTWEETLYIALGKDATNMYKWTSGATYATSLLASGPTWQQYTLPVGGYMPRAEITVAHANKLFVANTYEDGTAYPNRVRWSHENRPEDWFVDDYIDIIAGGDGVRGLQVVDGQLLIFKPKAVYLLMGYDADSFQLVELSTIIGIDYPQQATQGDGGVYFFDYPKGLFFYDRNGIQYIFDRLSPIIINNQINSEYLDAVTLSFVNDRLWMSAPFDIGDTGVLPTYPTVNFVFDRTIGPNGAFTMFQSASEYGLVSGCDWEDSTDTAYHLMINPDSNFPYIFSIDEYSTDNTPVQDKDAILEGATPSTGDFATQYTTAWFYDDRYVQDKTFVRGLYVVRGVTETTQIQVNVYHDFNNDSLITNHIINLVPVVEGGIYGTVSPPAATYSTDGSGGVYGESILKKGISVGGRLKSAKAVQLEFNGVTTVLDAPGRVWGINSIAYKYKRRKVRSNR